MGFMSIVLDIICLGVGIFLIYASARMKKSGKVEYQLLLSSEVKGRRCKNERAFIEKLVPRVRIAAGCIMGYAVLEIVNQMTIYNGVFEWVITAFFILVVVLYSRESGKLANEFF